MIRVNRFPSVVPSVGDKNGDIRKEAASSYLCAALLDARAACTDSK